MTVYLVGAGPGDPGMLTLRGAALLARCDLVVHDRLVDPRVLAHANPAATRVDVGKRPGASELSQQEINTLLVGKGRDGVVVRLKGGDPYLLGRGGEEAAALAEAGVAYEVVPGVSSALAVPAAAGVPVTLRGVASAVVILTGHDPDVAGLDELARSGATLVVLMAGATRGALAARLISAGMEPATPVLAVESGTLPTQRSVRTTLARLGDEPLVSPLTIVIGEVAAAQLFSYEQRPLAGLSVVVTRRAEQSGALLSLLEEQGARALSFPVIAIAPPADGGAALAAAARRLSSFAWLVLPSENAVTALFARLRDARELAGVRVATVGRATARLLAARGVTADLVPERGGAAALLECFPAAERGARLLLVHAAAGLARLERGLRSLGYEVEVVAGYSTGRPEVDPAGVEGLAGCDAVMFASPSAVDSYLALAGRASLGKVAVSIGPTTTARLSEHGIAAVEAEGSTPEAMVAALLAWRQGGRDGAS